MRRLSCSRSRPHRPPHLQRLSPPHCRPHCRPHCQALRQRSNLTLERNLILERRSNPRWVRRACSRTQRCSPYSLCTPHTTSAPSPSIRGAHRTMQRCVCISRNFQEMNVGLLILRAASDSQHGGHLPPHLSESPTHTEPHPHRTPPTPNPLSSRHSETHLCPTPFFPPFFPTRQKKNEPISPTHISGCISPPPGASAHTGAEQVAFDGAARCGDRE